MTIVLVGGGSGGHITPLLAVAHELKKQQPNTKLIYIGEKGGGFFDIAQKNKEISKSYAVRAGKFRRYHSQSWISQAFDIKTNLQNVRDMFYVGIGYKQSKKLLAKIKPDIVFIKGGFVGVPVGRACAKLGIPYITHDSDTVPGLANRLIAKNALLHTVGMPKEFYEYPAEKTEVVGIPLIHDYVEVTPSLLQQYRTKLELPKEAQVVFVSGGSLGAGRLNTYMALVAEELLTTNPNLFIIHQVGKGNLGLYSHLPPELMERVQVYEFIDNMYYFSGAADLVISRAGATSIAELALQAKPTILVPNPYLTGGHQLINAQRLMESGAVKVLHEETLDKDPEALTIAIDALLRDKDTAQALAKQFRTFAHPKAAYHLATIILESIEYEAEQKRAQ